MMVYFKLGRTEEYIILSVTQATRKETKIRVACVTDIIIYFSHGVLWDKLLQHVPVSMEEIKTQLLVIF